MINRFALSFLCIELGRNEIFRFTGLYILLTLNIFAKILPASLLFEVRVRPSVRHHPKPKYLAISSPQFSRKKHLGPFLAKGPVPTHICQTSPGIQKFLANLKPHKATGPNLITPAVLEELSHEISPILEIIFNML